jgi:hypothetical protein
MIGRRIAALGAAFVALGLAMLPAACASAAAHESPLEDVPAELERRDGQLGQVRARVTTPNEMATLFELLARGRAVSPAADSAILDILEHNEDNQMLQRFAGGARAAHKTGGTDAVRTECSLFYLASRVVACVMTKENVDQRWVIDTEPQVTIARMGEAIVNAWGPAPTPKPTP